MYKRILEEDWLKMKPYEKKFKTDSYYVGVANNLKKKLFSTEKLQKIDEYIYEEDIDNFICFLTSYIEDKASDLNIFNTFTKVNNKLYNKLLPFYPIDKYDPNGINHQDIKFLIWYFFNSETDEFAGDFVSPFEPIISDLSIEIFTFFESIYSKSPANTKLKSIFQINEEENNYYIIREVVEKFALKAYLFYPDINRRFNYSKDEIMNDNKAGKMSSFLLNENIENYVITRRTILLNMRPFEWVAELIGEQHRLYEDMKNLSKKIMSLYQYKGQDEKYIYINHVASGMDFNMLRDSFSLYEDLKEIDLYIFMGIIKWQKEWWFSGMSFSVDDNENFINGFKNSFEDKIAVNFLKPKEKIDEQLALQAKYFKQYNNGSLIAFLPAEKVEEFYKGFMLFLNEQVSREKGIEFPKEEKENIENSSDDMFEDIKINFESGLVFYNSKSGIETAFEVNSAFPMKENPFYDKDESESDVEFLLMYKSFSIELVHFCIDNFSKKLSYFKKGIGKKYLKDLDFLLRFWKKDNYISKPVLYIE